jgi:DNA-directed RNA polymerase specialized sigma24 family protein
MTVKEKGTPWTVEHHREVFRLRFEEGLFLRQIAELCGGITTERARYQCRKAERLERQGKL